MYPYDDYEHALVREQVAQFRDQVQRRPVTAGVAPDAVFKGGLQQFGECRNRFNSVSPSIQPGHRFTTISAITRRRPGLCVATAASSSTEKLAAWEPMR